MAGKPSALLVATESPNMMDIAWAAGLFEGEGHIKIQNARPKHGGSTGVVVSQKDPWILERLVIKFGGHITKPTPGQPCHQWRIHGARARGFALTIYSFLSPRRREQVRKVLG